ncbi:MAG: dihydrofolate reductase [Candidatus Nanosalina sp.]
MEKVIIAAVAENGVIGKDGELPWHFPEDMKHFKKLTTGNPVMMGRTTFESLPDHAKPLPDRTNIVLTHSGVEADVHEAGSMDEAYSIAEDHGDLVFIAGGASVYEQALPDADRIELTRIHGEPEGDTYFPEVDWSNWREVERDGREELSFITYRRK